MKRKVMSFKIIYAKKLLLPVLSLLFVLCLIIFSGTAINAAIKGINLWLNIVFPSLFPFFVASEILRASGFVRVIGIFLEPVMRPLFNLPGCGSFAFLMGITSGYPVGAKITAGLREEKLLTRQEAERLLAFSNNSGPLFIIGAVSVGMFKMPELGLFLLACHIAACITVGVLFKFYSKKEKTLKTKYGGQLLLRFKKELLNAPGGSGFNSCNMFGDAVKDSVMTMLMIGGFIIFFSVIINFLLETGFIRYISDILSVFLVPAGVDKEITSSVLSGFFEITTGTNMLSKTADVPLSHQLAATSLVIGWAGLSVHSQVLSIINKTDISIKPYLFGKCLQGIFSAVYTIAGMKIAGSMLLKSKPAFFPLNVFKPVNWFDCFLNSCGSFLISVSILIIATVVFLSLSCLSGIFKSKFKLILKKYYHTGKNSF